MKALTPEERLQSRRETMKRVPAGRDVWVFGYGSLMWNPAFHFAERGRRTATGITAGSVFRRLSAAARPTAG